MEYSLSRCREACPGWVIVDLLRYDNFVVCYTESIATDINFQGLSDYENSTTRTTPTSALALFYSARSYEHFDLFYLSPFAKLQNPPEGKVSKLFRSKVGDFPPANLRGIRPNLHWSGPPTPILCHSTSFYGSAAQLSNSFYRGSAHHIATVAT